MMPKILLCSYKLDFLHAHFFNELDPRPPCWGHCSPHIQYLHPTTCIAHGILWHTEGIYVSQTLHPNSEGKDIAFQTGKYIWGGGGG